MGKRYLRAHSARLPPESLPSTLAQTGWDASGSRYRALRPGRPGFVFPPKQRLPYWGLRDPTLRDWRLGRLRIRRRVGYATGRSRESVAEQAMGRAPYRWPRKRQTKRPPGYCERYSYNKHCFVKAFSFVWILVQVRAKASGR